VAAGEQLSSFTKGVTFLKHVYTAMIDHCKGQKPLEACGLLSGISGIVYTHWPMTNVLCSPNAFKMDDQQIEMVLKQIKERQEQLVGIYHSHPTSFPYPSPNDVIHATYPEVFYVIVSLLSSINPEVGCFRIQHQQVTTVKYILQAE
jgi:[CysO sulfur-carrier protein]-S-L-cysteine hydrolase